MPNKILPQTLFKISSKIFFSRFLQQHIFSYTALIYISLIYIFCLYTPSTWAGAQKEEHLAFSVRTALSQALVINEPPKPEKFLPPEHRGWYQLWRQRVSERLAKKIPNEAYRLELIDMIFYEARRAELEPTLVLGLIQVESSFRKYAISPVGARGLMQVMPFWVKYIGDGDLSSLFNTQTNLRYGCVILRQYLAMEKQNHFLALGRYNGSRGKSPYPNSVLGAANSWYEWVKDVPR